MNHVEAYERLGELVGVRVANRNEAQLLAHVTSCPSCTARLRELEAVERILHAARGTSVEAPPVSLERRVLAIPVLNALAPRRSRRRTQALALAAAAAVVAALSLALAKPWVATETAAGFQPARQLTLLAGSAAIEAQLTISRPSGSSQPFQLVAEGLPSGSAGSYALWLVGPDGSVMLRSFRPNGEGSCIVDATAPPGRWTRVAITRGNEPPTSDRTMASAAL